MKAKKNNQYRRPSSSPFNQTTCLWGVDIHPQSIKRETQLEPIDQGVYHTIHSDVIKKKIKSIPLS